MPEPPVDLSEFARLRNIPELLRQSGINYPGLSQAPTPQAFQDLMRAAPVAAPAVAGGGLGFLGMLAALLAQGGSADPNAQRFYEQRATQGPTGPTTQPPEPDYWRERIERDAQRQYEEQLTQPRLNRMTSRIRTMPIQEDLRPPSLARRKQ